MNDEDKKQEQEETKPPSNTEGSVGTSDGQGQESPPDKPPH